ncbi:MAG: sigma 54-interacting transcriptional regulator [Acidobacteria bacterium]|nr:sigma 54-interacting transcriptional regulator [Acidobacteriota bacterium]MCB9398006.1 sigma 54-interacting transcriptional regulator [Acidobacteriota bacterium]
MLENDNGALSLLDTVRKILDRADDRTEALNPVLVALGQYLGRSRVALSLLNQDQGEIVMESAHGLSREQMKAGRYKLGEGVTGRVIASGKPELIADIRKSAEFLHRTIASGFSEESPCSFLCVPVFLERKVIGSLSAVLDQQAQPDLEAHLRLMSILSAMMAQAVRQRQLQREEARLKAEYDRLQDQQKARYRPANIIGTSKVMQEVYAEILTVAPSDATVMLRGESGVGKELVAHAIHYQSNRAKGPFVKVNCAALPETILESELFGHEKGAFTGALRQRLGRFEQAQGGTLFLDEVGDFSPSIQVTLLRILQERSFERVGSNRSIPVDVRIIAATNRNLEAMVEEQTFRQDLYYRFNVFPIHVPPLRERKTDVVLLADYFVDKYARANRKSVKRISSPAIDLLMSYHWPGNVRELENCIERAVLLAKDQVIRAADLPPSLQTAETSETRHPGTLASALDSLERELILDALKTTRGNMASAARELGITERIMGLRIKKYRIRPSDYRKQKRSGPPAN